MQHQSRKRWKSGICCPPWGGGEKCSAASGTYKKAAAKGGEWKVKVYMPSCFILTEVSTAKLRSYPSFQNLKKSETLLVPRISDERYSICIGIRHWNWCSDRGTHLPAYINDGLEVHVAACFQTATRGPMPSSRVKKSHQWR